MQWERGSYTIDTDRERLDMDTIVRWLPQTYWAKNRPAHDILRSWEAAGLVFGLYDGRELVSWAKVITDFVSMAYLGDVFVVPSRRRQGLGVWLVESVLSHPELTKVRWLLHTADAHALYEKFGFQRVGERLMERPRTSIV